MNSHDKSMPNESSEYRIARSRLLEAEIELRAAIERVAEQRRQLPLGGKVKENYCFTQLNSDGTEQNVQLSELFAAGKDTLILYSFMYGPDMADACPACTSVIDGLNAMSPHLTDQVNLAIVAKSPIQRMVSFANSRSWTNLNLLSSHASHYNRDYWAETHEGRQMPMMNVFVRKPDGIHHFWGSEMLYAGLDGHPRHVDLQWPLWNLLDLTPDGRGNDWHPKLNYSDRN